MWGDGSMHSNGDSFMCMDDRKMRTMALAFRTRLPLPEQRWPW